MNETALTVKLRKAFPPGVFIIKHTDQFNTGVPDLSLSFRDATSWWEIKYANPHLIQREIQVLRVKQFSYHARVRYVIFDAVRNGVQILDPTELGDRLKLPLTCNGFDFKLLAETMMRIHLL